MSSFKPSSLYFDQYQKDSELNFAQWFIALNGSNRRGGAPPLLAQPHRHYSKPSRKEIKFKELPIPHESNIFTPREQNLIHIAFSTPTQSYSSPPHKDGKSDTSKFKIKEDSYSILENNKISKPILSKISHVETFPGNYTTPKLLTINQNGLDATTPTPYTDNYPDHPHHSFDPAEIAQSVMDTNYECQKNILTLDKTLKSTHQGLQRREKESLSTAEKQIFEKQRDAENKFKLSFDSFAFIFDLSIQQERREEYQRQLEIQRKIEEEAERKRQEEENFRKETERQRQINLQRMEKEAALRRQEQARIEEERRKLEAEKLKKEAEEKAKQEAEKKAIFEEQERLRKAAEEKAKKEEEDRIKSQNEALLEAQRKLAQQTPDYPPSTIPPLEDSTIQRAFNLITNTKQLIENQVKSIDQDPSSQVKSIRVGIKKTINILINQVANTRHQVEKSCAELINLFKKLSSYNENILTYGISTCLTMFLNQCEVGAQIECNPSSVWAYAIVLERIHTNFPQMYEFLEGRIYTVCGYCVPFYIRKPKSMSLEQFSLLRMQRASEDESKFQLRMAAYLRLWMAFLVTKKDNNSLLSWIKRFSDLNFKQARRIAVIALLTSLEIIGYHLIMVNPNEFRQIITGIETQILPKLKTMAKEHQSLLSSTMARLEHLFEQYHKKRNSFDPPAGQNMKEIEMEARDDI